MTAVLSAPVRGVLFDLDNTLHDRDEAFVAWAVAFVRDTLGVTDQREAAAVVNEIVTLDDGGRGDKLAMFESMRQRYPASRKSADEMLADFFAERTDHMALSDGVCDLISTLESNGTPWGIVTNGMVEQWDKLRKLGLDKATDTIFVSSDFGAAKPTRAIFVAAAKRLGISPDEVLFVGDHPDADIRGAFGAGMKTAWLRRGRQWPASSDGVRPDLTLESIDELVRVFS